MAVCQQCGAQNRDGSKFCTTCGAAMGVQRSQPTAQRTPQYGGGQVGPGSFPPGGGAYPANYQQGGYPAPHQQGGGYGAQGKGPMFCTDPVTMWTYAGMILLAALFPIGVIIAFVYGYGENTAREFKMFCKYYLLFSPIGLIMAFVYAFGSEPDHTLKTLSKGFLICMAASIALTILFYIILFAMLGSFFGGMTNY